MIESQDALILIVDDQPDNLDTMMGYLDESENNYKFSQAMNGQVAIKVAEKRLPDIIIMDWEMPVMNGYDALIALKNNPITSDIPIVMATGRSSADDLDRALNSGAADYIRKPIEKQELLARVRTCLSLSRFIKEIKNKNETLADLSRERIGMISIVAHDLKSPLNNIKGFTELLGLEGDLSNTQQDYIERIKSQVKNGSHLITDLLDIHSYEHSESEINRTSFNLTECISEWQLGYEQELSKKNQELITDIPSNITISTDKIILSRILDNVLTNAMKFSENGKNIYLKVAQGNNNISISIKDEGPGISVEDQGKMFKMFQKLTARPTDGETSNGLGLSIIKTLIKKLNGSVEVQSELGKGSEFTVSLPVD